MAHSDLYVSRNQESLRAPLHIDTILLAVVLVLLLFGMIMIYSTTGILSVDRFSDPFYYLRHQGVALFGGLILLFFTAMIPIEFWRKFSSWCFPISIGLLLLTFIPGLGEGAGGAQRWIQLPGFRFQPGEAMKVFYLIFLAGYFSRHDSKIGKFGSGIFKPILLVCIPAVFLLLQPDFGTAAVLVSISVFLSFSVGSRIRQLLFSGLVLLIPAAALIIMSPYRLNRILGFLSPFSDVEGRGYQLIQSLIAVGGGGWTGVGLGNSQQKLFFLPAAHTDFIFAVIAEELGFLGALSVIFLFLIFFWRGVQVACRLEKDTFAFVLAMGLTLVIVVPALLNIGVVLGLLPTKGLVLPLIGYGGSSLVSSLFAIGVLLALSRKAQQGVSG